MRKYYKAIRVNGEKKDEHRHIMEVHIGRKLTTNEVVHHKDGNILNNDLSNLEILSRSEHTRMHSIGRPVSQETREKLRIHSLGVKGNHKLTREQALKAKEMVSMGMSKSEVSRLFNINRTSISRIVLGKGYKWI